MNAYFFSHPPFHQPRLCLYFALSLTHSLFNDVSLRLCYILSLYRLIWCQGENEEKGKNTHSRCVQLILPSLSFTPPFTFALDLFSLIKGQTFISYTQYCNCWSSSKTAATALPLLHSAIARRRGWWWLGECRCIGTAAAGFISRSLASLFSHSNLACCLSLSLCEERRVWWNSQRWKSVSFSPLTQTSTSKKARMSEGDRVSGREWKASSLSLPEKEPQLRDAISFKHDFA